MSVTSGVFETLLVRAGVPLRLEAHLARLEAGARAQGLPWPPPGDPRALLAHRLSEAAVQDALALRLEYGRDEDGALRLSATTRALVTRREVRAWVAPRGSWVPGGWPGTKELPRGHLDRWRERAQEHGAWEALLFDAEDRLVEGSVTSVFVALGGVLATPALARGALPGIVRAQLLTELEREPIEDPLGRAWRVGEAELGPDELARAQELMLTNALVGVLPVRRLLDRRGRSLEFPGGGGVLARALGARLRREHPASR